MTEEIKKDSDIIAPPVKRKGELDAAEKSLSEALRLSFIVLKVIMVIMVIIFLGSGFKQIESDEQGIVLTFGGLKTEPLDQGLHWVFPYPIQELIRIPVEKKIDMKIDSFWYFQTDAEIAAEGSSGQRKQSNPGVPLNPVYDGYSIVRGHGNALNVRGSHFDYNIVHSKWYVVYKIDNPGLFYKNVYVEDVKPGDNYFDIIKQSTKFLIESIIEDAVTVTMVRYTMDEAMNEKVGELTAAVKQRISNKLEQLETGITVESVQISENVTWPAQVDMAFQQAISASQDSDQKISEARTYAQQQLNEAGGEITEDLLMVIESKDATPQQLEALWSQVSGKAQEAIAEATAYRAEVVGGAESKAVYLTKILDEYKKNPDLIVRQIYYDALTEVFANADEKIVIQMPDEARGKELRIQISRDYSLKPKKKENDKENTGN